MGSPGARAGAGCRAVLAVTGEGAGVPGATAGDAAMRPASGVEGKVPPLRAAAAGTAMVVCLYAPSALHCECDVVAILIIKDPYCSLIL